MLQEKELDDLLNLHEDQFSDEETEMELQVSAAEFQKHMEEKNRALTDDGFSKYPERNQLLKSKSGKHRTGGAVN